MGRWVRSWTGADPSAPVSQRRARRLRRAVWVLLFLGVGGFLIDGANRPANPYLLPGPAHPARPAIPPSG